MTTFFSFSSLLDSQFQSSSNPGRVGCKGVLKSGLRGGQKTLIGFLLAPPFSFLSSSASHTVLVLGAYSSISAIAISVKMKRTAYPVAGLRVEVGVLVVSSV